MTDTSWPIVWAWRTIPKWTLDPDIECGIEPTADEAKRAAEIALGNPQAIAAIVSPIGLVLGEWVRVSKPEIGLKSSSGAIRWIEPA